MSVVLVYQMGKIGSVSIVEALAGAGFRKGSLDEAKTAGSDPVVVHAHSHAAVADLLGGQQDLPELRIITGMRRVLDRNVSAFFENADKPANAQWHFGPREKVLAAPVGELIAFFRPRNLAHTKRVVLPWFASFAATTGIDVLQRAFDTRAGWTIFESNGLRCLLYRQEDLVRVWGELRRFTGAPLDPSRRNVGGNKWYAERYRAFKEAYRPSPAERELCERNDLMRHFYGENVAADRARFEPAA